MNNYIIFSIVLFVFTIIYTKWDYTYVKCDPSYANVIIFISFSVVLVVHICSYQQSAPTQFFKLQLNSSLTSVLHFMLHILLCFITGLKTLSVYIRYITDNYLNNSLTNYLIRAN